VSDLQQWLEALFGHWQHWAGGAGLGVGVLLAIVLVQRLFRRRVTRPQCAAIFLFAFGADASYLAWRDQHQLNQRSVSRPRVVEPVPQPDAATQPPAPEAEARIDRLLARKDAEVLAADIQTFFISRDVLEPKPPHAGNPAAAEWKQFELHRDRFNGDTLDQFNKTFGDRLTEVLDKLNHAGIDTGDVQAVSKQLSHPNDVKDIAVKLNALSKE
jgi:hypothetical protein